MHDEGVDQAPCRVAENTWKRPYNPEAVPLPETDRKMIGADHQIELHRGKSAPCGLLQRVLAHHRSDPFSAGFGQDHVTGIRDVGAASHIIWPKEIGPENATILQSDKWVMAPGEPIGQSVFATRVGREDVSFTSGDRLLENRPDSFGMHARCGNNRNLAHRRTHGQIHGRGEFGNPCAHRGLPRPASSSRKFGVARFERLGETRPAALRIGQSVLTEDRGF